VFFVEDTIRRVHSDSMLGEAPKVKVPPRPAQPSRPAPPAPGRPPPPRSPAPERRIIDQVFYYFASTLFS